MGIKGSSTRTVYFDNVQVPVENVLGEIGKGYKIAFNILNIGRAQARRWAPRGGAQSALDTGRAVRRRAQGVWPPAHGFGMIKKKLAYMAADIYAAESLALPHRRRCRGRACRGGRRPAGAARGHRGVRHRVLHRQGLRLRGAGPLRRRGRAGLRRLRLHGGVSHRARLPRRAHQPHLRGHERGQPPRRRRHALPPRDEGRDRPLMAAFPEIEAEVASGKAPDFATDETPAALRESVNLVERLKRAAIYTIFKGAHEVHGDDGGGAGVPRVRREPAHQRSTRWIARWRAR